MIDLHSLSALFDDQTLVSKYLQRFTDEMPKLIKLLWEAYATQNWNAISLYAHTYKTQMQYINEPESIDLSMQLEKCSANVPVERAEIERLLRHLDHQLQNILEEIHRINV